MALHKPNASLNGTKAQSLCCDTDNFDDILLFFCNEVFMAGSLLSGAKVIIEKVYLREKKELITTVVVQVGQYTCSCTVMGLF